MLRTVLSPTNCGEVKLQYIRDVGSSPMCGGEEEEISLSPASQLEVKSRSMCCDSFTVKKA